MDCLGTWLTAIMDGRRCEPATADVYAVLEHGDGLCAALTGLPTTS